GSIKTTFFGDVSQRFPIKPNSGMILESEFYYSYFFRSRKIEINVICQSLG
ncbi:hypothetical protein BDF21DRAFT_332576, partial [Thamnidium elegans]